VTRDRVDERIDGAAGRLGCRRGERQCPGHWRIQRNRLEVGKPVGSGDRQDGRCQPASDELGGDRVVGDFVGVGRMRPASGKSRIDALADSPAPREVDEVLSGEVGELIVRAHRPWLQSQGYFARPEETVNAWRNGWLHSGDAVRMDEDGYYYFLDRYKDTLRRRGENISSYEVEREVAAYPGVAEAACVAHPGEFGGDDEVKIFVVPAANAAIDFGDVIHGPLGNSALADGIGKIQAEDSAAQIELVCRHPPDSTHSAYCNRL